MLSCSTEVTLNHQEGNLKVQFLIKIRYYIVPNPPTTLKKGEAGTGNVVNAVHHARTINGQIRRAKAMDESELYDYAKELQVSAIKNLLRYGQNTLSSIIYLIQLREGLKVDPSCLLNSSKMTSF